MNKTVNINLGGFFFHIDEDAYQKLNRYFDAIRASLSTEGRDEIMSDIEGRISELFSEKTSANKEVISLSDVDDVIAVMGQPEDYKIEEDTTAQNFTYTTSTKNRKLYRDGDSKIIAGVCSGLGHYFGVDAVWIRVALILLVFAGFGTGIIAYIILWAVTPEAITTSEKLEMKGEPINISNIEKKVREEFQSVSDRLKNQNLGNINENIKDNVNKFNESFRTTAQRTRGGLGDAIVAIATAFAKVIGAFMVMIASVTLIGLLISLFTLGSSSFVKLPWTDYFDTVNYANTSVWFVSLLSFLAVGIPFFFLLLLGLKILVTNIRSIGNIAKYTLLAIWLMAVSGLIVIGIKTSSEFEFESKVVEKKTIDINPTDTLKVKFRNSNYFSKNIYENEDFKLVQDSLGHEVIYSNEVTIEVLPTDERLPFLQVEKNANGKSFSEAKMRASKIDYAYKIVNNQVILDNYFVTDIKNKFRDQEVRIYLYVPKGTILKPDASVEHYDRSDNQFFNLHFSSDKYTYKVDDTQIKCLNCPADENEWNDVDQDDDSDDNATVIINEDGIKVKKDTTITNSKEFKELKINEDGIIIKTK